MSGFPVDFDSEEFDTICKNDFSNYDKNSSGFIEKKELRQCLVDLRNDIEKICPGQGVEKIEVTDESVSDILSGLDVNEDGKLNYEEFKELSKMMYTTLYTVIASS